MGVVSNIHSTFKDASLARSRHLLAQRRNLEDSAFSKVETLKAESRQKSFGWVSGRYIAKLVEPTRSAGHHL